MNEATDGTKYLTFLKPLIKYIKWMPIFFLSKQGRWEDACEEKALQVKQHISIHQEEEKQKKLSRLEEDNFLSAEMLKKTMMLIRDDEYP
jgi:hypothetical protein